MIRSNYLGFLLFAFMMVIFFVIPGYEGVQKPFRIALCLSFPVIYFSLLIKKEISYRTLIPIVGATLLLAMMAFRGTLQSSFVNAWLCLFGLLSMKVLFFEPTKERKENLRYIHLLAVLSILLQFLIYSYQDGRPKLAYELNLSGAYLFLFFIAADILGNKWIKLLVIALSLLLLSRLLIFSIVIYFLVKYGKKYFAKVITKLNATWMALGGFVMISLLSLWYTSNIRSNISYETGFHRIVNLNDGSNQLRFKANTLALGAIFNLPPEPQVLLGYGPVQNFLNAKKTAIIPHNELLDSIIEFGLITVIFFSLFTLSAFNRLVSFANLEYFIPLLFYTLILWVRYLLVPSLEMLFVLFLLHFANEENQRMDDLQSVIKHDLNNKI
ncbi:MAG: hypothetical protein M1292_05920 [Bacteroidetes bacterium]|nr:hypothetical protein [Bacteroidota bacterium]